MTTVLERAAGGKSHSWLTPTTCWSRPRAKRISVADGSSETIRIGCMRGLYHSARAGAIYRENIAGGFCRKRPALAATRRRSPRALPRPLIFAQFLDCRAALWSCQRQNFPDTFFAAERR